MACTINADDGVISGSAGVKTTADTTGALNIQTNGTTAISISSAQVVSFPSTTSIGTLYFGAGTVTAPSISTTGDSNTGIYFPAADTIAFAEGGVEAARFDSSGNLLVGGTTANSIVQVTKNVNNSTNGVTLSNNNEGEGYGSSISFRGAFGAPSATEQLVARITGFVTGPTTTKGGGIAFATGTGGSVSERARIDSSGNVGINVTPSAWGTSFRVIEGGSATTQSWIGFQTNASHTKWGANSFYDGSNYKYKYNGFASYADQSEGNFYWNTASSGTAGNTIAFTQVMTLSAGGNLGVGTASPDQKFVVTGQQRILSAAQSFTGTGKGLEFFFNSGDDIGYIQSYDRAASVYKDLRFRGDVLTFTSGTGSERARINSSGVITTSFQPAFLAKAVTINKTPWSELTGYASQLITSNRSSGFNLTTGRFTAPVAGVYTFSAIARGSDNSGQDAVPGFQLWKNGSMYENIDMWGAYAASYAGTIRPSFTFSVTIELAAGDYVSIAYTSTATNYVWFSGFLNG